jgi:hypothetical protein
MKAAEASSNSGGFVTPMLRPWRRRFVLFGFGQLRLTFSVE